MFIKINKSNAEDCPSSCLFRKNVYKGALCFIECTLFNTRLESIGYADSRECEACFKCQDMYNDQED